MVLINKAKYLWLIWSDFLANRSVRKKWWWFAVGNTNRHQDPDLGDVINLTNLVSFLSEHSAQTQMCLFSHRPSVTLGQHRSLNLTICLSCYKTEISKQQNACNISYQYYILFLAMQNVDDLKILQETLHVLYRVSAHFRSGACLMSDDNLVSDSDNEFQNLRLSSAWSSSHEALRISRIICSPDFLQSRFSQASVHVSDVFSR